MRAIIPIVRENFIARGFISTRDICLFDLETNEQRKILFSDIIKPGKGIIDQLREQNITSAIVGSIQLMALKVLSGKDFVVYMSDGCNLEYNLKLLKENKLKPYKSTEALSNGTICSGNCSSCTEDNLK